MFAEGSLSTYLSRAILLLALSISASAQSTATTRHFVSIELYRFLRPTHRAQQEKTSLTKTRRQRRPFWPCVQGESTTHVHHDSLRRQERRSQREFCEDEWFYPKRANRPPRATSLSAKSLSNVSPNSRAACCERRTKNGGVLRGSCMT
jgi:hypothetical protein